MPLTPIDIQQKTFGPELRGYNMDEVDDFLDEVVTALKDYDQRVRDAQDRIRALEAELSTRGEDESAISRALVAAQKQADALLSDAQADAARIRSDAQVEADQLRSDRETERMTLTQDIARMRATVADLKRRIGELAASAQADLDAMDEAAAGASTEVAGDFPAAVGYEDAGIGEGLDVFGATERTWSVEEAEVEDDEFGEDELEEVEVEEVEVELVEVEGVDEQTDELDVFDEEDDLDDFADETSDFEAEVESAVENAGGDAGAEQPDDRIEADLTEAPTESRAGRRPWERGSV